MAAKRAMPSQAIANKVFAGPAIHRMPSTSRAPAMGDPLEISEPTSAPTKTTMPPNGPSAAPTENFTSQPSASSRDDPRSLEYSRCVSRCWPA